MCRIKIILESGEWTNAKKKNVNVTRDGKRTLYDWEIYGCDNGISSIHGKELPNNRNSIAHTTDLTLKQIFDISTRLVSEQDEISGLEAFGWENHSWKYLSSIGDERIINLQRTKIYVFSDSVLCLGKIQQKNGSKSGRAKIGMDQIFSKLQRLWRNQWWADWIRVDHFPGFTTLQLYGKVTDLLSSLGETETFTRRILFMSMFNDISSDKKDHGEECLANAEVVSIFANKLGIRQWSFCWSTFREEVVFSGWE